MINRPFKPPGVTYRLQLHKDFNFKDLEQLIPYLSRLGITDIYTSPIFVASPGSMHGYDVNDPAEINPELGGMNGLLSLREALTQHDMGFVQDIVPNHMGIFGPNNWRWLDVLANGTHSRFADYFDIEWNSREKSLQKRVLVPILHDFYGKVLESGDIRLIYEAETFWINYRGQKLPVCSVSYGRILERLSWQYEPGSLTCSKLEDLARQFKLLSGCKHIDENPEVESHRILELQKQFTQLIDEQRLESGLMRVFHNINGTKDQPSSFDALHEILEEQHYRLAYWKVGAHEINYRRFFAIDSLVGVKIETPQVFQDCHQLIQHLVEAQIVTGLRIDHIDGLWNPKEYLERIQERSTPYVIVEKILNDGEDLPADWAVHGTTGYEFCGDLINLLTDADSETELTRIYERFTGNGGKPDLLLYELKRYIIEELFPNALDSLSSALADRVRTDRYWRDFTVNELRDALKNILSSLAIYRTYHCKGDSQLSTSDAAFVNQAVDFAASLNRTQDLNPYDFIRHLWLGEYPGKTAMVEDRDWADRWIGKLQQITGAIMAKSVEDTFFYRYVRLMAANEVGHDPRVQGRSVAHFHERNLNRQKTFPCTLLTTSTHDTKMSEDVRARLMALSEIPEEWSFMLDLWHANNQVHKTKLDDRLAPDFNEEYLLYQGILGAWPLDQESPTTEFTERINAWFQKSIAEAKVNTNWNYPNVAWAEACTKFVQAILTPGESNEFLKTLRPFHDRLACWGMLNSLTQVILKCTCPGVPDVYQGNELWDFSLVDPDNRRPVDYQLRQQILAQIDGAEPQEMLQNWKDGRIKLFVTQALLKLRKERPLLFSDGDYQPLAATGLFSDNIVAFLRAHEDQRILVVTSRVVATLGNPPVAECWKNTTITISPGSKRWRNLFTGQVIDQAPEMEVCTLLSSLPFGIFEEVGAL